MEEELGAGRMPARGFWHRAFAVAIIGAASTLLGGCNETTHEAVVASIPSDYRQRHPIVIEEANTTTEIFVGIGRGGLSETQRSDVAGVAQSWLREGTGAIVIEVPTNTPNSRVAKDSARDVQAILAAAGVPPRGVRVHYYSPDDPRLFATIRLTYPRIVAEAGPCGVWPADLGPSIDNPNYFENRPYHNFGCATQRNMAAMVANPSDLVQPRAETAAYTSRRNIAFDKYRKGESTTTSYPDAEKAKLSDLGK
jgi:pilus assembly protein CpaD